MGGSLPPDHRRAGRRGYEKSSWPRVICALAPTSRRFDYCSAEVRRGLLQPQAGRLCYNDVGKQQVSGPRVIRAHLERVQPARRRALCPPK